MFVPKMIMFGTFVKVQKGHHASMFLAHDEVRLDQTLENLENSEFHLGWGRPLAENLQSAVNVVDSHCKQSQKWLP